MKKFLFDQHYSIMNKIHLTIKAMSIHIVLCCKLLVMLYVWRSLYMNKEFFKNLNFKSDNLPKDAVVRVLDDRISNFVQFDIRFDSETAADSWRRRGCIKLKLENILHINAN